MDSFILFFKSASLEQLITLAVAFVVWFLGGYFLKKKLRQRLESQNIEFSENIRFEDIDRKEWRIFAVLAFISIGLVILAVNLPAL